MSFNEDKVYAGGTPNFDERTGSYTGKENTVPNPGDFDKYSINKPNKNERDKKRTEFVSNFKSRYQNGKQRMAGDYLNEFMQSNNNNGSVMETLSGSRDYRGGVRNQDPTPASPKPSTQTTPAASAPASQPKPSANTDKKGRPLVAPTPPSPAPKSKQSKVDKAGNPINSPFAGMTEGQKLAQNVRPEYAAQAAEFYDNTQEKYGSNPELAGNILTYMGGDLFLPDPKKWEAKMKTQYANKPELLSNILTYMGGNAGKVGHNR